MIIILNNEIIFNNIARSVRRWDRRRRFRCLTGVTLHQSHLVAVHALEGNHFGGKVISVYGFLAAVAHRTRQKSVAPADLARRTRVRALKQHITFV